MRNRDSSFLKRSSDFNLIYNAANTDNRPGLTSLLEGSVFVDVRDDKGLFTPAARLAFEGNHHAVAMLQSFNASNDYIAMGYACAGDFTKAEELLKTKGVNIKYLAVGAAMNKHHQFADKLRQEFGLNPVWLVYGAALGGQLKYLKKLMNEIPPVTTSSPVNIISLHEKMLCAEIKGLVMGGHLDAALEVLDKRRNDSDLYLRVAIKAAARVGNDEFLKKIIVRNGSNPHLLDYYYSVAAEGAAKGGYIGYAHALLYLTSEGARNSAISRIKPKEEYVQAVLKAGLSSGHFNEMTKEFPGKVKLDKKQYAMPQAGKAASAAGYTELAVLAALHGNINIAEELYSKQTISMIELVKAMDQSGYFYNEKLLTYALSFIKNQDFLRALTAAAIEIGSDAQALKSVRTMTQGWTSAFENKCFTSFKECANRAARIHNFMAKFHLNYNQSQALIDSAELRKELGELILMEPSFRRLYACHIGRKAGLDVPDMLDLVEKSMLIIAKKDIHKRLESYYNRNYYYVNQHCNRAYSLQTACDAATSRSDLRSLLNFQYGLIKGDIIVRADDTKPKHEQPLKNPICADDDYLKTIEEAKSNFRLA